jgi:hypothetical protein
MIGDRMADVGAPIFDFKKRQARNWRFRNMNAR